MGGVGGCEGDKRGQTSMPHLYPDLRVLKIFRDVTPVQVETRFGGKLRVISVGRGLGAVKG